MKKICPKCKQERDDVHYMWDLDIDGEFRYCTSICAECDNRLSLILKG